MRIEICPRTSTNRIPTLLALGIALGLTGCLLDPEKKPDKVIYVDCRNSYDGEDSTGAYFSCPVNDNQPPPGAPK
jgi:hypothetical protein